MRLPLPLRAGALGLFLARSAGCHRPRPGEYRPRPSAACEPARISYMEGRFEQLSEPERRLLEYCRQAQATEALRATQEHVDYIADLQFLGIVLGVISVVLTLAAGESI